MACSNTAKRLHQTWDGGDGKTWIDVPCGTRSGHLVYLCMECKGAPMLMVPEMHRSDQPLQAEIHREMVTEAKRTGRDLEKAR